MNRGRLIALDRPERLKTMVHEPLLELRTDQPARAVEVLRDHPVVVEAAMFGRGVHLLVRHEQRALDEVPRALHSADVHCGALHPIAPSLEDVFVALVRREGGAPV